MRILQDERISLTLYGKLMKRNVRGIRRHWVGGRQDVYAIIDKSFDRKSQIAIEWVYQVVEKDDRCSIFWIHASTPSRFEQGYRDIATKAKLSIPDEGQTLETVHKYLSDEKNSWFIILDNVDDNETFTTRRKDGKTLRDFIPVNHKVTIVVTSRNQVAAVNLVGSIRIIHITPMRLEDSLDLLRTRTTVEKGNEEDARKLIQVLEHLPLAITHAGSYISARAMTISRYLTLFKNEHSQIHLLADESLLDSRRDGTAAGTVMATWQISFEAVQEKEPTAANLLKFLCMFDNQSIPRYLIRAFYELGKQNGNKEPDEQQDEDTVNSYLEADISLLASFSLLTAEGRDLTSIKIHRLVQLSMVQWLEIHKELGSWERKSILTLAKCFPRGKYEEQEFGQMLIPHAEKAIKYRQNEANSSSMHRLASSLSWFLGEIGRSPEALQYARVKLKIAEDLCGKGSVEIFPSLVWLGLHLQDNGRFIEAEQILSQIDCKYRQPQIQKSSCLPISGNEVEDVRICSTYANCPTDGWLCLFEPGGILSDDALSSSVDNFALFLSNQRHDPEAELIFRRRLQTWKENPMPPSLGKLLILNNFALLLSRIGKEDESENIIRQVYEGRCRMQGKRHPETLCVAESVAIILSQQGKKAEAEGLLREIFEIRKEIHGPEDPRTIITSSHLATQLYSQRRYQESLPLLRDAVAQYRRAFGENHIFTLLLMVNLAFCLYHLGHHEEAEYLCKDSLPKQQLVLADWSQDLRRSRKLLILILEGQGKYAEAEDLRRKELGALEKVEGDPEIGIAMHKVAFNLLKQGRLTEAEEGFRKALQKCHENNAADDQGKCITIFCLWTTLRDQGKLGEAADLIKRYHRHDSGIGNDSANRLENCLLCERCFELDTLQSPEDVPRI